MESLYRLVRVNMNRSVALKLSLSELKFLAISKKVAVQGLNLGLLGAREMQIRGAISDIGRTGLHANQCFGSSLWGYMIHQGLLHHMNIICIYIYILYIYTYIYTYPYIRYTRHYIFWGMTHSRQAPRMLGAPFRYGWSLQQDSVYAFTGCGRDGEPVAWTTEEDSIGQRSGGSVGQGGCEVLFCGRPELDDFHSRKLLCNYC